MFWSHYGLDDRVSKEVLKGVKPLLLQLGATEYPKHFRL